MEGFQSGDTPFEDEPTEGFIRPCRGAQSLLQKLHFLLQTLWTGTRAGITTTNLSDTESKIVFGGFALQRSLCQHWPDRSAETSCPLWSDSPPLRLCVTKTTKKTLIRDSTFTNRFL